MSLSATIDFKDRSTPALKRKIDACAPQRLNAFIGPRVVKLTQNHFLHLPHNKKGWKSTNFWADAARSTHWQTFPEGVMLSVSKIGVRQRYHGGIIRPVNAKALTIPIDEHAYGKTAADFGDQLILVRTKDHGAFLALMPPKNHSGRAKKKEGLATHTGPLATATPKDRLLFLFKLCASIEQDADADVLPTDQEYLDEAIAGAKEAVK